MDPLSRPDSLGSDVSSRANRRGGGWLLHKDRIENWAWADVFTKEECASIIALAKHNEIIKGETISKKRNNERLSNVSFLFPSMANEWVFQKVTETVHAINRYFKFDLYSLEEGIQFTEYVAPSGNYNWHVDCGPQVSIRKLSISIQLTDPDDYEGGELELNYGGKPQVMDKVQGRAVGFPSYTLHRVAPVTVGVRHSLVIWVSGPPFK